MTAGFLAINDFGNYQIDGEYANLSLLRSGSVVTSRPSGFVYSYIAKINLSPGEVLAVASAAHCGILWRTSTEVTLFTDYEYAGGGATVNYWIFGKPSTESDVGIKVFSAGAELVFDSGWRPLNVVGQIAGNNSSSFNSGRDYAVVMLEQYWNRLDILEPVGGNQPDAATRRIDNETSGAQVNGTDVNIKTAFASRFLDIVLGWNGTTWTYRFTNDATARHLVIDVTGY